MLKTKTKVKISLTGIALVAFAFLPQFFGQSSSAATCTTSPCPTTFQVNVKETLAVNLVNDTSHTSVNTGEFAYDLVTMTVTTNSSSFTASMYPTNSSLTNAVSSSHTIPTWSSGTYAQSNFPSDKWGYSAVNSASYTGTYSPMTGTSSSPTSLSMTSGTPKYIYFGSKISTSGSAAGTYTGTVVFKVVTAYTPTPSPVGPSDDTPNDNTASYVNNQTVYTTTSSTSTSTTTTTQVTDGDVRSLYPLGETKTTEPYETTESNIQNGSKLATGLAIAASTAAAGGMLFFILAKRREDDEEDEEQDLQ